ncbi:MAG TPA: efflux RND transporter periplasmic adaptor subunit [Planctomycetia bacterium]|nr:efflux RND transporter periplasmic adaptor subunit [Planctomycetia bacterium]
MNGMMKIALFGAGFALLGAIVNSQLARNPELFQFKWKLTQEAPLQVQFESAVRCNIVHAVTAPGEIEAEVKVEISSQVPGRIERMPIRGDGPENFSGQLREGDTVRKSQVLVVLDSRIYRDRLRGAEALAKKIERTIVALEADCTKSLRDLERNRPLIKTGAIGSGEFSDLQTMVEKCGANLRGAREDLEAARATAAQAKKDLEECTIRAPMDGVVSKMVAEEGENVILGTMNNPGTVIMTVSDMRSIVVRARIDETYIPLVKPGQKARIFLQCDEELVLNGLVKRVSPKGEKGKGGKNAAQSAQAADPNELAKFETLIQIEDPPPAVRLGMTGNVEIQVDERKSVVGIPPHAVLQRRAKDLPPEVVAPYADKHQKKAGFEDPSKRWYQVVFVEDGGFAKCKVVRTGISDEHRVEILADPGSSDAIKEGDRIVTGPFRVFDKLKQGRSVTQYVEAPAKDA